MNSLFIPSVISVIMLISSCPFGGSLVLGCLFSTRKTKVLGCNIYPSTKKEKKGKRKLILSTIPACITFFPCFELKFECPHILGNCILWSHVEYNWESYLKSYGGSMIWSVAWFLGCL
uniref:Uncharacterized protein n=1 Tax=Opuntia streptacantha TaxID=393608 RepID=A0A7C8ZM38_OPUST